MKKKIGGGAATTLQETIDLLLDIKAQLKAQRPSISADVTYVTLNSDSVRLILIEETLTDGSKVYNIEVAEAAS